MLMVKTEIGSSSHGIGLFAAENINIGQQVWKFDENSSKIITSTDGMPELFKQFLKTYAYYVPNIGIIVNLDNARYMNHSDNPNICEKDDGCNYATRDIKIGEEITCDYRIFDGSLNYCGSFLNNTNNLK